MRFGIHRRQRGEARLLFRRELGSYLAGDGLRHLALQSDDILQLALVAAGPEVRVCSTMDELDRDPHPVTGAEHRPLDDALDTQLFGYFRHRHGGTGVTRHRGSRDDTKRLDLAELVNQRLVHTGGEILLPLLLGKILQRKNGK